MRDRLFLTVAARTDQNSAFGTNFQRVLYPKVSLSWLVSDEIVLPEVRLARTQFRLRACVRRERRAAGRDARRSQTFAPATTGHDRRSQPTTGTDTPGLGASNPGNANLKPETSAEFEAGFETHLLNNRVHLDYTFYNKKTHDALISVPIAAVGRRRR